MTPDNRQTHAAPRGDSNREDLSALFDGELHGDAARFAMRRLGHDADWRDACGRWQLLGDVLRGQACAQAPAGFAGRVEAALAAERPTPDATAAEAGRRPARRTLRWGGVGGAALAASVAVVAFLGMRPDLDQAPPPASPDALVTSLQGNSAGPAAPTATSAATAPTPLASVPQAGVPARATPMPSAKPPAAVAVAEPPRLARDPGTRSQAQRAGLRVARESRAPAAIAAGGAADAVAALPAGPLDDDGALRPFLPPADEIRLRPWPRADYRGDSGFTASYSTGSLPGAAPPALAPAPAPGGDEPIRSFYPFEPRLSQPVEGSPPPSGRVPEGPRP